MIKENLLCIQKKILSLNSEQKVKIVAVSKRQPVQKIKTLLELGITDFGENYVQEFIEKYEQVKEVNWHFIGNLQSKKVKDVIGKTALIHTVDREKIVTEINKRAEEKNIVQNILMQVNVASEASKSGVLLDDAEKLIEFILKHKSINLIGLMTMPPIYDEKEKVRADFSKLRENLIKWNDSIVQSENFFELSMGTSHDYEYAIKEGATMIRLGTTLLGERNP